MFGQLRCQNFNEQNYFQQTFMTQQFYCCNTAIVLRSIFGSGMHCDTFCDTNIAKLTGRAKHCSQITTIQNATEWVKSKMRKEKGKLENTLIVITSDHGNYNYGKSTIYEGGIKIPLGLVPASVVKSEILFLLLAFIKVFKSLFVLAFGRCFKIT